MSFISELLILLGSLSCFIGAIGVLRFPDAYARLHAGTKCLTAGGTLVFLGIAFWGVDNIYFSRAMLLIVFFYMSNPVATHALARACYLKNVAEPNVVVDEYLGCLNCNKEDKDGSS